MAAPICTAPVIRGVLHYQLFVVDFVIDSDKRPWPGNLQSDSCNRTVIVGVLYSNRWCPARLSDMFPMSEDTTDEVIVLLFLSYVHD